MDAGKAPKDIKDPRLQIELHVFSHNGGVQTFSPHRDGFFRSGAWNACVVSSDLLKALPFFDGGVHMTNAEEALTADDVPTAWKSYRAFKREGVGLDEDLVALKTQILTVQRRLVMGAEGSIEEARELIKAGKIHEARTAWMVAQDHYTKAGVIAESSNFDNFSNVKGRILPVDATASVVGEVDVLMEESLTLKFAGSLAQMHTDIRQAEIVMRVLRRMNAKLLIFVWEHWIDFVVYLQRLREVSRRIVKRIMNVKIARSFNTWMHWLEVRKNAQALLAKVKGHCIEDSFCGWQQLVQELLGTRRAERARLDRAYTGAEASVCIAQGLRESKMLHKAEQKCYAFLLTMVWEEEDVLVSKDGLWLPCKGQAQVGFDADKVEHVDWENFTARAAEKHKLRPAVFSRLAQALEAEASYFLNEVKPEQDEFVLDVAGVLSKVYQCRQQLREAAQTTSTDVHILSLVKERRGHIHEMAETCRRLAIASIEVWRRAQWLGEVAIQKAEDELLQQRPPRALLHLAEARKRFTQANALTKRPNILSTKVRALGALKLFRAIARQSASGGSGSGGGVVADVRFKEEISFERLLQGMSTQAENVRKAVEAHARAAIVQAQNELEGTDDRAGGEYEAVRLCLLQCAQYCEKIDMTDLELFVRQKISDDADEAELAELRGVKRLQQATEELEGSALVESRDLLTAARNEFAAAHALHRHTTQLQHLETALKQFEKVVYERGLAHLQQAVKELKERGDAAAARECVAQAITVFFPLGGFDLAAAAAAGTAINLTYFLVDGIKMRENAVGPEEKNRMTAQERFAWDTRSRSASFQKSEDTFGGGGGGEGVDTRMIMGETGQSRARLVGEEYLDLPDFSDMHELSGHKVDTLLKTIGQCERGQNFARTYLLQARQAIKCFMFGMARKHTDTGLRFAVSCFAHHLKEDLWSIDKEINSSIASTATEGETQMQLAIRLMGDLHIHSDAPHSSSRPRTTVAKAKISSISSFVEVNEEGTVKERRMEGLKEAQGGEGEIVEEEEAGTRKTIKGCGDVWAAHAALQQARFLFGAAGNTEMMARVPAIKASIDTLLALSNAQARGLPQELQYGGANHYTGSVNTFFESDTPTILGEAPNAPRWVEAKAGQLVFTISPDLFRGLSIDRFSGRMSGFPEVEGAGTFQVRVANALGCASFFFTFVVSEDPLVLAQKTPRLARRIELMMLVDPQEAERELKREKKSRLSRFAGPFPAAYQVGRSAAPMTNLPVTSRAMSPRLTSPGGEEGPAQVQTGARRERSEEFVRAAPGHGVMNRSQLQVLYKDYQLF